MAAPEPRKPGQDWNPESYGRFADLRLRPALDLLARVADLPPGPVIDLGCGAGAAGPALAARFANRRLIGIDSSAAMLERARATGAYAACAQADIAIWQPDRAPALIFSNAVLHWLAGHDVLLARLVAMLAPRGILAVQMPVQWEAPSHRLLREIAAEMFPERFDTAQSPPPVLPPAAYFRLLAQEGTVDIWSTEYLQRLPAAQGAHPVRRFTESTALRPFAAQMSTTEEAAFLARYDAALAQAYPPEPTGEVLFPFRRLFLVLRRG